MELKFQFFQSLRSISQSTSQPQNVFNIPSNSNRITLTFPYTYNYRRPIGPSTGTTYAFPEPLIQNAYSQPPQTHSLDQSNSDQFNFY